MDRDLLFDIRLQPRHLARKVLSTEELETYLRDLRDASDNAVLPGGVTGEAPEKGRPQTKAQKDSKKR